MGRLVVLACCLLLCACASTSQVETLRRGIVSGEIDPVTYDFAAIRFAPGADPDVLSELHAALSPPPPPEGVTYVRVRGCDSEQLRARSAWPYLMVANASPDLDTARADAAALRQWDAALAAMARAPANGDYLAAREAARDPRAKELFDRVARDQRLRGMLDNNYWRAGLRPAAAEQLDGVIASRMTAIDCDNTAWLRAELQTLDWFDITTFGARADHAAWLLVQHADRTPSFQHEVLARLHRLAASGGTNLRNLAYLTDRVAIGEERPQTYGTQGDCLPDGSWAPLPIENEAEVDSRRRAVGLEPLAQYVAAFNARRVCPAPASGN